MGRKLFFEISFMHNLKVSYEGGRQLPLGMYCSATLTRTGSSAVRYVAQSTVLVALVLVNLIHAFGSARSNSRTSPGT